MIDDLWRQLREHGPDAALAVTPTTAEAAGYLALVAYSAGRRDIALRQMALAARLAPADPVFGAAAAYLARMQSAGAQAVYAAGDAFGAFIRGGGNVPLYRAVSAALAAVYRETGPARLLDIGAGDGLALLPALTADIVELTIVEPSTAMLARTEAALRARGVNCTAFAETLQAFSAHAAGHWEVIEATWSLQSLAPPERAALLPWLRAHGDRLVIAEFDVPEVADLFAPAHVASVFARYRTGLAEYGAERELVAQGFLMPVMLGYFDQTAARVNFEQPIAAWVAQLRAAGFAQVQTQLLDRYWWAPAYVIDARA